MVGFESSLEFLPGDNMICWEHGKIVVPPKMCSTAKLWHGETGLVHISARHHKKRILGFNGANPSIHVQWFLRLVKQRGLSVQKLSIARSLRFVDIVPIPLLPETLCFP
jgi:hypothetical protein